MTEVQQMIVFGSITPHTGHTQKNGAVSKVNKKFISHPTWAQHTLSAAATFPSFSCVIYSPSICAPWFEIQ
jgi:hypothetical protein